MSVLALIGASGIVVLAGFALPERADRLAFVENDGLELIETFSLAIFCIAGHCCFPMLYAAVGDDRQKCTAAVDNGFILWAVVAVLFGLSGYYVYGSSANIVAIANVGHDLEMNPVPVPGLLVAALNLCIL